MLLFLFYFFSILFILRLFIIHVYSLRASFLKFLDTVRQNVRSLFPEEVEDSRKTARQLLNLSRNSFMLY